MAKVEVLRNGVAVGVLEKEAEDKYLFVYHDEYIDNEDSYPISVTLPKQKEPFVSDYLFSFFSNLLSEGNMKKLQCRTLKIDEDDEFTRLMKTATHDTIGSVVVREIEN